MCYERGLELYTGKPNIHIFFFVMLRPYHSTLSKRRTTPGPVCPRRVGLRSLRSSNGRARPTWRQGTSFFFFFCIGERCCFLEALGSFKIQYAIVQKTGQLLLVISGGRLPEASRHISDFFFEKKNRFFFPNKLSSQGCEMITLMPAGTRVVYTPKNGKIENNLESWRPNCETLFPIFSLSKITNLISLFM